MPDAPENSEFSPASNFGDLTPPYPGLQLANSQKVALDLKRSYIRVLKKVAVSYNCVLDKSFTEGGDNMWGNVSPRFGAGFPFPLIQRPF